MQNFTDCEMKEAIFLQEVSYVGLKHLYFTQDTCFSLERLFCFLLDPIVAKRVISIMVVMCNMVLDCTVVFHMEVNAWSTSFIGSQLPSRQKKLQGLPSPDCYTSGQREKYLELAFCCLSGSEVHLCVDVHSTFPQEPGDSSLSKYCS